MDLTVICPIIRRDLIGRCLETFYKYSPPNFYFYIIDQTVEGLDSTALRDKYPNLMIIRTPKTMVHTTGNLGFAKATNLGISLVETPYFMMLNDDTEMINRGWWWGVLETFKKVEEATPDRPPVLVSPASLKLADWSVGRDKGDDFYILPYKTKYTQEDYDFLVNEPHYINEHLTIEPGAVFDGVVMYASVCHTKRFLDVGMLNEAYYPGGAEDYDWNARANMKGYRSVGTTLAWMYHHWSKSLNSDELQTLADDKLRMGDHNQVWGQREDGTNFFDTWGVKCLKCNTHMVTDDNKTAYCKTHPEETYAIPEPEVKPL